MLAMTFFGLGEVFGSFFIGFVIDRKGSKKATLVILFILVIVGGITFAFIGIWKFNAIAYIMCFAWGF